MIECMLVFSLLCERVCVYVVVRACTRPAERVYTLSVYFVCLVAAVFFSFVLAVRCSYYLLAQCWNVCGVAELRRRCTHKGTPWARGQDNDSEQGRRTKWWPARARAAAEGTDWRARGINNTRETTDQICIPQAPSANIFKFRVVYRCEARRASACKCACVFRLCVCVDGQLIEQKNMLLFFVCVCCMAQCRVETNIESDLVIVLCDSVTVLDACISAYNPCIGWVYFCMRSIIWAQSQYDLIDLSVCQISALLTHNKFDNEQQYDAHHVLKHSGHVQWQFDRW